MMTGSMSTARAKRTGQGREVGEGLHEDGVGEDPDGDGGDPGEDVGREADGCRRSDPAARAGTGRVAMPTGTAMAAASPTMIRLPTMALEIPPPGMPAGVGTG